jgi:hypothetical protein
MAALAGRASPARKRRPCKIAPFGINLTYVSNYGLIANMRGKGKFSGPSNWQINHPPKKSATNGFIVKPWHLRVSGQTGQTPSKQIEGFDHPSPQDAARSIAGSEKPGGA